MNNGIFQNPLCYVNKNIPYINYLSPKYIKTIQNIEIPTNNSIEKVIAPSKKTFDEHFEHYINGYANICFQEIINGKDVYKVTMIKNIFENKYNYLKIDLLVSKQIVEELMKSINKVVVLNYNNKIVAKNFF